MINFRFLFILLFYCGALFAADYEIVERTQAITIQTLSLATEHHSETVRILTKGGSSYRKILPFNGYVTIKNVTGTVTYPDGHTHQIRDDDVFEIPVMESARMMTDAKALLIVPPDLEKGTVIQFEYDRMLTSLLYIDPWIYAGPELIRKTSCSVSFPSQIPIKYYSSDPDMHGTKGQVGDTVNYTFAWYSKSSTELHQNFDFEEDVTSRVVFVPEKCMTDKWMLDTASWQNVADWFSRISQLTYTWDPAMDPVVNEVTSKYKDQEQIAEALYEYVQKSYVYTAIEIGIGGYKPHFTAMTFQKKYGDCKDLAFLYISLLRKAGVEAYPALIDTRSSRFFLAEFPSPTQFNHCIVYLPKIRKGTWVDCTVKNFRLGEVPAILHGKFALVCDGPNTLIQIPIDPDHTNQFILNMGGAYDPAGVSLSGKIEVSGLGSMVLEQFRNVLLKDRVQSYVYNIIFESGVPIQTIKTGKVEDRTMELSYSIPVEQAQEFRLVLVNPVKYQGLDALPLNPVKGRLYSFGAPMRLTVNIDLDLRGHQLVADPIDEKEKGKYLMYTVALVQDKSNLHYSADVYFANGLLDASELTAYQQELRQFQAALQRSVVIR